MSANLFMQVQSYATFFTLSFFPKARSFLLPLSFTLFEEKLSLFQPTDTSFFHDHHHNRLKSVLPVYSKLQFIRACTCLLAYDSLPDRRFCDIRSLVRMPFLTHPKHMMHVINSRINSFLNQQAKAFPDTRLFRYTIRYTNFSHAQLFLSS